MRVERCKERIHVLICETFRTDRFMETERRLGLLGGWELGWGWGRLLTGRRFLGQE